MSVNLVMVLGLAILLSGCGGGSSGSQSSGADTSNVNSGSGSSGSSGTGSTGSANTSAKLSGIYKGARIVLESDLGVKTTITENGTFQLQTSGAKDAIQVAQQPIGENCNVSSSVSGSGASDSSSVSVNCSSTLSVLYQFTGPKKAGSTNGQLAIDANGNLYGAAQTGGENNAGVVYMISPAGVETDIYSFGQTATDGAAPQSGLLMDSTGNLYGTTKNGGTYGQGTVYRINKDGTETILYSFGASSGDGSGVLFGVIQDALGNLYGTTVSGGAYNQGTVYKLAPDGTETILHSFNPGVNFDGFGPEGSLLLDGAGNLYGTTTGGGMLGGGLGTLYKIDASGNYSILYSFGQTATDALVPQAGVIMDSNGILYGATTGGGLYGDGTVYTFNTATGVETVLYSFGATSIDGNQPKWELTMDSFGNLFGTTQLGGTNNLGTVFVVTPDGVESIVMSFDALVNGACPQAGLLIDSTGNLYGTTVNGGGPGWGTVFEIQ